MTTARVQLITPDHLAQVLASASPTLVRRASELCTRGAVTIEQATPTSAAVLVGDEQPSRRVSVMMIAGRVTMLCDCAHRDDGPCLHRVAAAQVLHAHMTTNPPQPWEALLTLSDKGRPVASNSTNAHIVFGLHRNHPLGVGWWSYGHATLGRQQHDADTDRHHDARNRTTW